MKRHVCPVCGSRKAPGFIKTKDYNLKISDRTFCYSICKDCGTMRLCNIPEDMSSYYSNNYYSFSLSEGKESVSGLFDRMMKARDIYELTGYGILGGMIDTFYPRPAFRMIKKYAHKNSKILDVGCGDGYLLSVMKELGYQDLQGIDLYIDKKMEKSEKGLKITACGIDSIDEKYDVIMLHHSFEHMENPETVLKMLKERLKVNGVLIIAIPVAGSRVFRKYGKYWYQLDAPRHLYIHTAAGLAAMADRQGLVIIEERYDSDAFAYIQSERNKGGSMNLGELRKTPLGILKTIYHMVFVYSRQAKRDNIAQRGDQATFVMKRKLANE